MATFTGCAVKGRIAKQKNTKMRGHPRQPRQWLPRSIQGLALCATVLVMSIGAAGPGNELLTDSLVEQGRDTGSPETFARYDLFTWSIGPVVLGVFLSVGLVARNLYGRRKSAAADFGEVRNAASFRMVLLILLAFYLTTALAGLVYARANATGGINLSPEQTAPLESVFGPMRESLREGSPRTIVTVAAIVFAINVLGGVLQGTVLGLLLIPVWPVYAYAAWSQGAALAGLEASTLVSALSFICIVGLESGAHLISSAAGVHMGLSFMFPAWSNHTTRRASLHQSFKTALRVYCVALIILIAAAIMETFYVRQVLLHGGSGIPLLPY